MKRSRSHVVPDEINIQEWFFIAETTIWMLIIPVLGVEFYMFLDLLTK